MSVTHMDLRLPNERSMSSEVIEALRTRNLSTNALFQGNIN